MVEVLPFEQLHRNERLRVRALARFFDRIDRADVGMIQRRGGARLQQKAVERILIARQLRRQKLQRNFAPQVEIFRFIDHTHPAAAQLAGDAVMRDGLVDHVRLVMNKKAEFHLRVDARARQRGSGWFCSFSRRSTMSFGSPCSNSRNAALVQPKPTTFIS